MGDRYCDTDCAFSYKCSRDIWDFEGCRDYFVCKNAEHFMLLTSCYEIALFE